MDEEDPISHSDEVGRQCGENEGHRTESSISKEQLECLIDDDIFKKLKRHFLMEGKGRRPDLPPVQKVTNELLLQLFFIMEKSNSTMAKLKFWLKTLVPTTATITESRIYKKIHCIIETCTQLGENQILAFLAEEYDFQGVAEPLARLGLNRLHLTDVIYYTGLPPDTSGISNDTVVALEQFRAKEKAPLAFVRKWLRTLCDVGDLTDSQLRNRINSTLKKYKYLTKNNNGHNLNEFLKCDFLVKVESEVTVLHVKEENKNKAKEKEGVQRIKSESEKCLLKEVKVQDEVIRDLQTEKLDLIKRNKELKDKSQDELKVLKKKLATEKEQNEAHMRELEDIKKSNLYRLNHAYKRKLIDTNTENAALTEEVRQSKWKSDMLLEQVHTLKKQKKSEQTMKCKYKMSLQEQKEMNSEISKMLQLDQENEVQLREEESSHRYSDSVRKTFYALREDINIAAGNCSKVVSTVARNLFGKNLTVDDLPSESSALNFSNEAHIIAKQQIIEEIKQADTFTYACDGTSRDKAHYLEQHIYLSNGKVLSLGFKEIASDDSDTMLEQCINIFKDLSELHCSDVDDINKDELLKEIIKKMKCLMTDRASVCKAFDAKMATFKSELLGGEECSIHFVFCNAHFLLALSKAAEEGIQCVEEEMVEGGEKLGRDQQKSSFGGWKKDETAALRLIRLTASVLGPRCDEKSGCRQEWLAFCSSRGFKSTFTSFRSNRFNCLFQNATAVLMHRREIDLFLNEYVSHSNLKLESIIADLQDDRIVSSVAVLSFLHIFFTEPYWKLMKSNEKTHADFPQYVRAMASFVETWHAGGDPSLASSVFSDFEVDKECTLFLNDYFSSGSFLSDSFNLCLRKILSKWDDALHRQLSDFLDGGEFGGALADDVKSVLKSCPLTNLAGENLFGDMDYSMNLKRNASLHSRSTTNMWKRNKTVKWLEKVSPGDANKLLKKAIKYAPEWRQRHLLELSSVKQQIKNKIEENKRNKYEKDIKSKEKELSVIDAIIAIGGVATTKADLDALFSGPQAVEKLKTQIRYRSLIMGEKITLKGNKQMLYDRLLSKITSSNS